LLEQSLSTNSSSAVGGNTLLFFVGYALFQKAQPLGR
jgi:hypothetical protein